MIEYKDDRVPTRIWANVTPGTCWVWTGNVSNKTDKTHGKPTAVVNFEGKPQKAHRVLFNLLKKRIPEGFNLRPQCDTTLCVHPDHWALDGKCIRSVMHGKAVLGEVVCASCLAAKTAHTNRIG